MTKLLTGCAVIIASLIGATQTLADTYVRGYTKKNGTYVQPHYRTDPNNSVYDNYSTKGNTNPYTGKAGTKNPYNSSYNSNYGHNTGTSNLYESETEND